MKPYIFYSTCYLTLNVYKVGALYLYRKGVALRAAPWRASAGHSVRQSCHCPFNPFKSILSILSSFQKRIFERIWKDFWKDILETNIYLIWKLYVVFLLIMILIWISFARIYNLNFINFGKNVEIDGFSIGLRIFF